MKTVKITALILIISAVSFSLYTQAAVNGKYRFVLPILDEIAGSSLGNMLNDVVEVLSNELGIDSQVDKVIFTRGESTLPIVEKAFKKDKSDFGLIFAEDFVQLVKKDDKAPVAIPLAVLAMNGHKEMTLCIYVRKDSEYSTVGDLKGSVLGTATSAGTRYMLHEEAGYDGSLFDFYSGVKFISDMDMTTMVNSLVTGEIDSFTVNADSFKMARKDAESAKKLKTLACAPYVLNFMVASHRDVDPEIAGMVKKLFLKAHKDDAFSQFRFLFTAINGKFETVRNEDLEHTRKIMALSDKFNWLADDIRVGKLKPEKSNK